MALATIPLGENPGLLPSDLLNSPKRNNRPEKGPKRKSSRSTHSSKFKRRLKGVLLSAAAVLFTYTAEKSLDYLMDMCRDTVPPKEPAAEKQVTPDKPVDHHIIYIPVGPDYTMIPFDYQELVKCGHLVPNKTNCYVFTHTLPVNCTPPACTHQKDN